MEGSGLWARVAPSLSQTAWWQGRRRLPSSAAILLLVSLASEASIPRYKSGEVATNDVVAPFEFAVVNHEQTERLRREELTRVPAIYRCDPWVAVQAEEKFAAAFNATRAAFLEAMETAAKSRVLDEATLQHPTFWRFVEWFQKQQPEFPMTTNLVTAWALGRDDVEKQLRSALREAMSQYIRSDLLPFAADTPEVQVFVTEHANTRMTLDDLQAAGRTIDASEAPRLAEAQRRINLPEELKEFAPLLGKFVSENLIFEDWLTTLKRQRRAAELIVFDQYSPGQVVVLAGQVIDAGAAAALEVLATAEARRKLRVPEESIAVTARPVTDSSLGTLAQQLHELARQYPWALCGFGIMSVSLVWHLASRRSRKNQRQQSISGAYTLIADPRNEVGRDVPIAPPASEWQIELRQAEQRAEDLLAIVRAGLAPHLARELTHKLVQELVSQRATLLRAHQLAEREITALEGRFAKVCQDLQDRIAAYERRTAELEKDLIAKAEQTRELMNATILLTEQKLQAKKVEHPFAYN
jgi:hypothetical protein